jgi:hypothetical protein
MPARDPQPLKTDAAPPSDTWAVLTSDLGSTA